MKSATPKPSVLIIAALAISCFALGQTALAATIDVEVGPTGQTIFSPFFVAIQPGDTVKWTWKSAHHSVTAGTPENHTNLFDSGILSAGATFSYTFTNPGTYDYHCDPHASCCAMTGRISVAGVTPTPSPTPDPNVDAQPLNISTRLEVRTGDQVLIGGFIVTGTDPKQVILRAIGPSLGSFGIPNPLPDPILELHGSDGSLITMNDNWKATNQIAIEATGLQPSNDLESAILTTLAPGSYTAIVSGKNSATGVGLVEGYDVDSAADSQLGNISTRGFVETGSDVMIGGFILGGGGADARVLVRALGPTLTQFGVAGALANPTLELRDGNGTLVQGNDDWKDTQQTEIEATGLQPPDELESAILGTLSPGAYTAIVAGQGDLTGVGLVEIYRLP